MIESEKGKANTKMSTYKERPYQIVERFHNQTVPFSAPHGERHESMDAEQYLSLCQMLYPAAELTIMYLDSRTLDQELKELGLL